MSTRPMTKILVKIFDPQKDDVVWMHLCYADASLHQRFLDKFQISRGQFADYICIWAHQDFGVDLTLTSLSDVINVRRLVKERYRNIYPNLFIDTKIDRQAWLRVWITEHMRKELKNHDEKL